MKKIAYVFVTSLALFSCSGKKGKSEENNELKNQLIVTEKGDSLETGYWDYHNNVSQISKSGYYKSGYKEGEWKYKNSKDSLVILWGIYEKSGVKFNYSKKLQISDSLDFPLLFMGDIVDDDKNTYIALLKYDLDEMKSSIYDYLYQANISRERNSVEILKSKKVRKYLFKNIELFKFQLQVERESRIYEVVSYIFEIDSNLYDLTYKNTSDKFGGLNYEIFNDMLYSFDCQGRDLFTNNTGKYYKEELVNFE